MAKENWGKGRKKKLGRNWDLNKRELRDHYKEQRKEKPEKKCKKTMKAKRHKT